MNKSEYMASVIAELSLANEVGISKFSILRKHPGKIVDIDAC